MKNVLISVIVVVIFLGIAGYFFMKKDLPPSTPADPPAPPKVNPDEHQTPP